MKTPRGLEINGQDFSALLKLVEKPLVAYIDGLKNQPVNYGQSQSVIDHYKESLPQDGTRPKKLIEDLFEIALPCGINFPSAGYQAYIAVGGIFEAAIAELVTKVINRWPGQQAWSPAFVEIERTVIRWLCEIMQLPQSASGVLCSGGSMANFTAIYTAKSSKLEPREVLEGVLYCSDQVHHSIQKAAKFTGLLVENVKIISSDAECKIDLNQLRDQILADKKNGLKPFAIVGNGGSTATGTVDPLEELAKIATENNLWFHVDAAWAGGFCLTDFGKNLFEGIEKADSVTFDPHKALFMPFGSGAVLVKDEATLKKAHSLDAHYLPDPNDSEYNPSYLSGELSRTLRGLHVWFPIKIHGIKPFRDYHLEKRELTLYVDKKLRELSYCQVKLKPETAVNVYRFEKEGMSSEQIENLNKNILEDFNSDGRILISGAQIQGEYWLRLNPFGLRTHIEDVELFLELIESSVKKVFKG